MKRVALLVNISQSKLKSAILNIISIKPPTTIQLIDNDNDDNDNILFDHNIQIEIIMYNSLENQIINWSGDYY